MTGRKKSLRTELKRRLAEMSAGEIDRQSRIACEFLTQTDDFRNASTVMLFLSMPQEIDTTAVIESAWKAGKRVVVPRIDRKDRQMVAVEIHRLDHSPDPAISGLRNPTEGIETPVDQIDLIVAPGLAFDRRGNRLGRGGGYFDRFLADPRRKAAVVGFGFAFQVEDEVPTDPHDRPVDAIVTEQGVIACKKEHGGL
ncbi:MAG: 5-formyltetrahydrofolate cyclo-ligase [Phycisphaerae bacterium]|nr:5-formyltetrahydrofolate cyclo-ligase [Phycisphaerae bacterium]